MRTRIPNVSQRPLMAGVFPVESSDALAAALLSDASRRRGARFTGEPIRIAVLDRNQLMRQAMTALLARDPRLHVVGDSCDLEQCISYATHRAAQVVLLSAEPDVATVIKQVTALAAVPLGPHVIVLNGEQQPEEVLDAFRAGAFGYLPWSASVTELIEAIEMVADGMSYVLPTTAKALATGLRTPPKAVALPESSRLDTLSARERTVLERIARGFSGPEVAEQLGITVKTVDTYRHRIHEKLGVHHRSDYVRIALDNGLLLREPHSP
ncbi:response regulator transcription factor [Gemmatimonas groenlandica]|uniref:Response regulator transcription factor n=1 Tax=Gemmatimonas groenlandica TaxID=2732249 RepID=A0A6M4IVH6_9BACT|nr:response regulator transcription factor [Gemmatimonas groenlandica]QJR36822.1 response regulator transcription factor [Gemmatimonas groenlandica]